MPIIAIRAYAGGLGPELKYRRWFLYAFDARRQRFLLFISFEVHMPAARYISTQKMTLLVALYEYDARRHLVAISRFITLYFGAALMMPRMQACQDDFRFDKILMAPRRCFLDKMSFRAPTIAPIGLATRTARRIEKYGESISHAPAMRRPRH